MVTNNNNQVNLEQVCSLNIEQSRLLQFVTQALKLTAKLWLATFNYTHNSVHSLGFEGLDTVQ